ncbi:hypothetical protein C8R45DRAFT_972339 [Mycena sanguinolenta]|nr:hypothetical protein C8R45DRAFT_972339 [Mycena sanguinolenta]
MKPVLPLDLEREIFENAAIRDPQFIPTLLRVCHRIHAWVEPLLYRVLLIRSPQTPCLPAVQSKSQAFLYRSVRHVFFTPRMRNKIENVLKCTRITSLFIDGDLSSDLLPFLEKICPRKLYLTIPDRAASWAKSTLGHSMFRSVSHLELFWDPWPEEIAPWDDDWSGLANLPALTHLCLSEDLSRSILRRHHRFLGS